MGVYDDMDRHLTRKPEDDFEKPFVKTRAFRLLVSLAAFLLSVAVIYLILPHVVS